MIFQPDNEIEGFKFAHVANAYLSQVPLETTWEGEKIKWDLALDLLHPEIANAEQSCYLVCVNDEERPLYVGEYTGTFGARWLRKNKYVWHSKNDDTIKAFLNNGKQVSVWLSIEPYTELKDGRLVNISKVIEQIIIESKDPEWNITGRNNSATLCKNVLEITNSMKNRIPKHVQKNQNNSVSAFSSIDEASINEKIQELGMDDYLTQFMKKSKSWGVYQYARGIELRRKIHFLNYISEGLEPEKAFDFVCKEFPHKSS